MLYGDNNQEEEEEEEEEFQHRTERTATFV